MKKYISSIFLLSILVGCSSGSSGSSVSLDNLLENPLFAERYADTLVDSVVEFKIQKDPMLEDASKADIIEDTRTKWLKEAQKATVLQREGIKGNLISVKAFTRGETLYLHDKLYFGPEFETVPGPKLSIYLSSVLDPRDTDFPDETAIRISTLQSPYGAQSYSVPPQEDLRFLRTVVLWDDGFEMLWGFAQLK